MHMTLKDVFRLAILTIGAGYFCWVFWMLARAF